MSRIAGHVLVFGPLLHRGTGAEVFTPILLRWLFSLQRPVLRRKMGWSAGVVEADGSASGFGFYPPVLLWEMAFFILWTRVWLLCKTDVMGAASFASNLFHFRGTPAT